MHKLSQVVFENHGDWKVIALSGRLDAFCYKEIIESIDKQLASAPSKMVIDLAKVEFLNVSLIRFFIHSSKKLEKRNKTLVLVAPNDMVLRNLEIFASRNQLRVARSRNELEAVASLPLSA